MKTLILILIPFWIFGQEINTVEVGDIAEVNPVEIGDIRQGWTFEDVAFPTVTGIGTINGTMTNMESGDIKTH